MVDTCSGSNPEKVPSDAEPGRNQRRAGYHEALFDIDGPGDRGTLRAQAVTTLVRGLVRPALDRMPPDQVSLDRLRKLTSGAGRAATVETTNDWSADGPVPGLWVGRKRFFATDTVVYMLHGGGFTFGSPWSHKALADRISKEAGIRVFLPDYRLAPEHTFPAQIDDAVAGFRWLVDNGFPPHKIIVAGDSAGGNLALQLIAELADADEDFPAGVVLMSPWVDMQLEEMQARDREKKDPFLAINLVENARTQYAPDIPWDDPRISPVYLRPGTDWPPFLIQAGAEELFRPGIERLAENFRAAGVRHELQIWPNQFHVFQAFHPIVPEARLATRDIGGFIRGSLAAAERPPTG